MILALKITLTTLIVSIMLGIVAFHFWVESVSKWSEKFFDILFQLFFFIAMASFAGTPLCIIWGIGK